MAIKKTGDAERLKVLRGREAQALHSFMQKTGKFSLADLDEDQMNDLQSKLGVARAEDEQERAEFEERSKAAKKAAETRAKNEEQEEQEPQK